MRIHFISIGGSVMHQLAVALYRKGYEVSGSDDELFEPSASNLKEVGLFPEKAGWFPEKITPDIDAVILGMHARKDNPELQRAIFLGLKIYSFPEYIYRESLHKKRIAVGGSHGKTTTTAMIMHVLQSAGVDFDYLVGATIPGFEQSVRLTNAPIIVCEADEYPASPIEKRPKFHFLFPHIAVITGIAWDHINVFPTFDLYLEQFSIFMDKMETGGLLVYNETDDTLRKLVENHMRSDISYIPYGIPEHSIEKDTTYVQIGKEKTSLKVFGNHNLLNLQAAHWVCRELQISDHAFAKGISTFTGASKRLELIERTAHCNVYRDFAHAPSKVMASINAVRQQFPDRKLVAILELHTFSSLNKDFMSQYKGAMEKADVAIVFYSHHALELKRMELLDPQEVKSGFDLENLEVIIERKTLEERLKKFTPMNTNFLFMSSGNYDGMDLLSALAIKS